MTPRHRPYSAAWATPLLLALGPALCLSQQRPDTAAARQAIREYRAACARDGGELWGTSLCGPILLVDPATRLSVAAERPPVEGYDQRGDVFVGIAPGDVPLANTSSDWGGRTWAFVRMPLPAEAGSRTALLLHESFHRIQTGLGLSGPDRLNPHLDERDGRFWYRLELRAAAAALRGSGPATHEAAKDALLFRAERHARYPGADTLERALELQEGLAEYTGHRLAFPTAGEGDRYGAAVLTGFESRPTYVRSAGYASGPALGLLLDRYARGWRPRVRQEGLAPQLAAALGFSPPEDLHAQAMARAGAYGGAALAAEEDARAAERQRRLGVYRARLVDGPVLVLREEGLMRSFNPNNLIPFPEGGTVYPTGFFQAPWGTAEVSDGALVGEDLRTLILPAPEDTTARPIRGPGYVLTLAEGWVLAPGPRPGDLTVVRRP